MEQWRAARLGIITASTVGKLLTPTLQVADNDTSRKVCRTLAAERITGWAEESGMSSDMWRGIDEEPLARDAYTAHHQRVDDCGLMVRDFGDYRIGYSPDGVVGDDGLIEIKSRLHHVHMQDILSGRPAPATVMAQLQTALLVSGREWIDYISYSSGMHLWVRRVTADVDYQRAIATAAEAAEMRIRTIIADYSARVDGLPLVPRTPDFDPSDIEV